MTQNLFKMSHQRHTQPILSFLLLSLFTESLLAQIPYPVLTTKSYHVDKTGLIEEFFKGSKYLMICATAKFGKSVNLDMLKHFVQLEINETTGIPLNKTESSGYRLFTNTSLNLSITRNEDLIRDHLGEYPTVVLDFATRKINYTSDTFDHMLDIIRTDIMECFKPYQWLCDELERRHGKEENTTKKAQLRLMQNALTKNLTVEETRTSVYNLTEILTEYFDNKTVMVFVDEIVKLPDDSSNINPKSRSLFAANDFIGSILHHVMKKYSNTTHLARVFLTARSRDSLDAIKNPYLKKTVRIMPFAKEHPYNSYYGFSEYEVTKLCDRHDITPEQRKVLKEIHTGEQYPKGKNYVKIYNPDSIMKFLKRFAKPEILSNDTMPDSC
ncbi:uncharacterized protein LOC135844227 [Planococcus citri]|uniref:uncharacterized protein LOC135844227 n=1 Tax=Planococcus citri TaxID=170843 RepID=UPI0031F9BD3B